MLWSCFHLDNMDEKEQADRMAAAEALYMISTRVDKSGPQQKAQRRSRKKKKNSDCAEGIVVKRNGGVVENGADVTVNTSSRRGRSKRVTREGRAAGVSRKGRGGGGVNSSPRGRGGSGSSTRGQQRQSGDDSHDETLQRNKNHLKRSSVGVGGENMVPEQHAEDSKRKSRSRTTKIRNVRTKSNSPSSSYVNYSHAPDETEDPEYQAIGFTGAAISISESSSNRRSSIDFESSQHLQSQSLSSGSRQVSLPSRTLPSTATVFDLPSMNLASLTSELNLPSIPLDIVSLQLSSQATPNLSSLGDMGEGVMEDGCNSAERKKSEKFLPLKKRKLLNSSEAEVREPTPPMEASLHSDSEERSEPQPSPPPFPEPVRASYTVQAPPIITMQTLMEIKTALTADDDGDLGVTFQNRPLHIAVVHENMRMVIKLINLMRIAGKGVDKFNKQQQTPLHLAVKLNFLEAIDILLKSNANVNAVDCTGSSCIHMAVQGRSLECLTMLLERCLNADLNVRNFDGLTPLHIAVDNGDLHQVEMLLKHKSDIDVTDGKSGRTALFRAAESNQKGMVELLLSKGANPDVPNYAGVTTAMAAQGRNLHGVLKLLGSVATDKFTEYDTKPSGLTLESKPASLYLGFPIADSVASSYHNSDRGINLAKHVDSEITCLIEPKINTETPSNETKVFHNVFVVSQSQNKDKNNKMKSMSEPSSPEVKMEVEEVKERETFGPSGLMSLPEGIFCHSEEDRRDKLLIRQRTMATVGQGGSLPTSQAKLHVPFSCSRVLKNVTQRHETKPVILDLVTRPPFRASNSVVNILPSSLNTVSTESSCLPSKPVSMTPFVTPSSAMPPLNPTSSNDTVTLTGMQARLFQMLLKRYNIDPASEVSAGSSDSRPISSPLLSSPTKLSFPKPSLLPTPTTSPSAAPFYLDQVTVGQPYIQKRISEPTADKHDGGTEILMSSHSQASFPQYKLLEALRGNYDYSSDNGVQLVRGHEQADESPLNLTTTSNRLDNQDMVDKSNIASCLRRSDVAGCINNTVQSTPSAESGAAVNARFMSAAQLGPKGKVISFGVRRISDTDKGGKVRGEDNGQFEMFLLPGRTEMPVTTSSTQFEATSVTTLPTASFTTLPTARAVHTSNVSREKTATNQMEHKPSGEITPVPDLRRVTTSVSQKTASIVRDYLSQQNPMRFQNQTSSLLSSAPAPVSPVQASVPTVVDLAADSSSTAQKKQVITLTRSPSTIVAMGKSSPLTGSPMSSTVLLPVASTSPVFLHQGQVIDLSRSKVTESNILPTSNFKSSTPSVDASQGKIIGFSGAILSVAPSKLDRGERRPPKETAPKETQKKRGRKSQKIVQGSTFVAESGLGKINSETDEKLKKFLGAKKLETAFPMLQDTGDLHGDQTNGVNMEDNELIEDQCAESGLFEGPVDQTYKTVGMFSGIIQHVKIGRKFTSSPLPENSPLSGTSHTFPLYMSLSTSSPSSLDMKLPDRVTPGIDFEGVDGDAEESCDTYTEVMIPLSAITANAVCKTLIKQVTSETAATKGSDSSKDESGYGGNVFPNDDSDCMSKSVCTKLLESADIPVPKKSRRRSIKPPLDVITEFKDRDAPLLNRKGQRSRPGKLETDNNSVFISGRVVKLEHSKIVHLGEELSDKQGQRRKGNTLASSSSSRKMKHHEGTSGKSDNMQNISTGGDLFQKQKKRQRWKTSEPHGAEQTRKSVLVNTNKLLPSQNTKAPVIAGADHGLTSGAGDMDSVDNQASFLADNSVRTEVSNMEVDNGDESDEQPALFIEESEEMS